MLQEIITYMIVGSALTLAVLKVMNPFKTKKKKKKVDFSADSFSMGHNCSDCSAECMLRNNTSPLIKNGESTCTHIHVKSD